MKHQFQTIVEENYNFGQIQGIRLSTVGDNSRSCIIQCKQGSNDAVYYCKQHHPNKTEADLQSEHAFMCYFQARAQGKLESTVPVPTRQGQEWVRAAFQGREYYYAVYQCLSGKEPYSWWHNEVSENAFVSSSEAAAWFHSFSYGFESQKREVSLDAQMEEWKKELQTWLPTMQGDRHRKLFYEYCTRNLDFLLQTLQWCKERYRMTADQLPRCIIHGDLNPGNMKYDQDDHVCGIFDFDWVQKSIRLYDVAWMGHQMLSSWRPETFAELDLARYRRFLQLYNRTMQASGCPAGQLTQQEINFLPVMTALICVKIIRDLVSYLYLDPQDNTFEWLLGAWKHIKLIEFCKEHEEQFQIL